MEREDIEHLIDYARSALSRTLQGALGFTLPLPPGTTAFPSDPPVGYVSPSESISDALTTGDHYDGKGVGVMLEELVGAIDAAAECITPSFWQQAYLAALPQCIQAALLLVRLTLVPATVLDPADTRAVAQIACDLAEAIADLSEKRVAAND